uniref:Coagulation factor VII-like n=1 Tax=Sinocyclocheilus grahami TaxID=75366 RepID=A0A672L0R0_SINGR
MSSWVFTAVILLQVTKPTTDPHETTKSSGVSTKSVVGDNAVLCCSVFVGRDEAHGVLIRTKRANTGWFEELKMDNLERECLEEKCSYEEAREVFEHTEATVSITFKDHCESNPCENNGLCSSQNAESYMCLCSPGFSGLNCERDVTDSCLYDNGSCEHFCEEEDAQRNCSCAEGYFLGSNGQKCLTHGEKITEHMGNCLQSRIVGGAECPKGHCPWQVTITESTCSQVILYFTVKHLCVCVCEHDIEVDEGTEQVIQVEQMIMHPAYVSETSDNDIALLRLRRPIVYSTYAIPVCLPLRATAEHELWAISKHTVSGWGQRSQDGPTSRLLRRLQVPLIRTQECIESSNVTLTSNMFCAGYIEGKLGSCKGDSGGPLVTRYRDTTFLLSIMSWSKGCAQPGSYSIYTHVSNYLQWIHEQTANSTAATQ